MTLGTLVLVAAFTSLVAAAPAEGAEVRGPEPLLRPTHRHGSDPLDPYAAWFVSSYTATEPLVPYMVLDGATRGTVLSKETADPLRRLAGSAGIAVAW